MPGSMSSSSPEPSPTSATSGRHFSMSREKFTVDIPSPRLQISTNGTLHSPGSMKSPTVRRMQAFSREGILGSAQKARNLSQPSTDRPTRESVISSLRNEKNSSDDGVSIGGSNPLKRRATDAGIDYPRRRATIAVCTVLTLQFATLPNNSAV